MTTDRDPMIGALLDRLDPPPAPNLEFWDDLREQLDGGPRVVELRPLPHRSPKPDRRAAYRRRAIAALLAAAVIAAGVVGITRLGRDDNSERVVPVAPSTTVTTISPTVSMLESTVSAWITDLVQGDAPAAWALVGQRSRAMVDRGAFDGMLDDLKGTWSPWIGVGVERHALQLPAPNDDLWVVSMRLDRARNVEALIVQDQGGSAQVEPFVPGTALSLISLPFDALAQGMSVPTVSARQALQIHVEPGATSSLVAIDGAVVTPDRVAKDASGALVAVSAPTAAGLHDLLVVEVSHDGTIAVADQTFTVVAG